MAWILGIIAPFFLQSTTCIWENTTFRHYSSKLGPKTDLWRSPSIPLKPASVSISFTCYATYHFQSHCLLSYHLHSPPLDIHLLMFHSKVTLNWSIRCNILPPLDHPHSFCTYVHQILQLMMSTDPVFAIYDFSLSFRLSFRHIVSTMSQWPILKPSPYTTN